PLQTLLREAEVGAERGQRHEHDRAVEDHHEEGAAEERERPPAAGIESRYGRGARGRRGRGRDEAPKARSSGGWARRGTATYANGPADSFCRRPVSLEVMRMRRNRQTGLPC